MICLIFLLKIVSWACFKGSRLKIISLANHLICHCFKLNHLISHWLKSERIARSCSPEVFCKKGVLKNFTVFTGNRLCQSLFFNKVAGLRPAILLKKRLWHRYFPVNFATFLRTPFYRTHPGDCFLIIEIFFLSTAQVVGCDLRKIRLDCSLILTRLCENIKYTIINYDIKNC